MASTTSTAGDQEQLAAIVHRVVPGEVAERMVAAFRSGIAGYSRLSEPVVFGEILDVARANVELFFRSIADGQGPTEQDLAPFRESARNRAAEGMPLEDLLHAYRVGGRLGWQAIAAAARPEEQHALLAGAELLMDYVDQVSSIIAQAYFDERQHLVSEEERRLRALLEALCGGGALRPRERALAESFGLQPSDAARPFAVALARAPAREHSQLAASLRARQTLALTEGDRVTGLLSPGGAEPPAADGRAVLAVGEPARGTELSAALQEVRLLVDLGVRLGHRGLLRSDKLLPELLLASSPRVGAALARRVLDPLEQYARRRGDGLLQTLQTFVDCGLDRREAATRLHVHPNTLDYRLRRASQLTGLDLGAPEDLVLVALALKQRALAGPAAAPPGWLP